jgi:hypothetical protein
MLIFFLLRDTAIPETTTKSPKKFPFTSSPLNLGKKNEKSSPVQKKKDDPIKMSMMGNKDSKSSKGTKLLPVITRQRKPPVKGNKVQSLEPAVVGHVTDTSANHNTVEMSPANQKMKKIEDAKQKRKELFEASTKVKEEKVQVSYDFNMIVMCQLQLELRYFFLCQYLTCAWSGRYGPYTK